MDDRTFLQARLDSARDSLLWKLEGLSVRDVRMPRTPTGTNLLGVVKHCALVEVGYLGLAMGRPPGFDLWAMIGPDAAPNADLYAAADESRQDILELFESCRAHDDETIATLSMDAEGHVPWWPAERNPVTLRQLVVHVLTDLSRHAGHLDILRELHDGRVGMHSPGDNLPDNDEQWWAEYRQHLTDLAEHGQ